MTNGINIDESEIQHNLQEKVYFWPGSMKEFECPDSVCVRADFDFDKNTITEIIDNPQNKSINYVVKNVDSQWLLINKLQGNRNPVELKHANYNNGVYTVTDKIAVKISNAIESYRRESGFYDNLQSTD